MTLSRAQVRPHRGQLFFFKLTADHVLVFHWIANSGQVRHLNVNEAYFFRTLSAARRGYTAILLDQELLAIDAFRVQVEKGLENIFSCIPCMRNPRLQCTLQSKLCYPVNHLPFRLKIVRKRTNNSQSSNSARRQPNFVDKKKCHKMF